MGEQETESDDDADGGESGQDPLHVIAPSALVGSNFSGATVKVDLVTGHDWDSIYRLRTEWHCDAPAG
jgi:hypothetical protein